MPPSLTLLHSACVCVCVYFEMQVLVKDLALNPSTEKTTSEARMEVRKLMVETV